MACALAEGPVVLLPETKPRSLAHADAGDRVDVYGLCCCPGPMLPLTVKSKEATLGEVSMMADAVEKETERLLRQSLPPPHPTPKKVTA